MVEVEVLDANFARLRAPDGRVLYVEARRDRSQLRWYVHVDGYGRRAARSYPCPSQDIAVYRVMCELSSCSLIERKQGGRKLVGR